MSIKPQCLACGETTDRRDELDYHVLHSCRFRLTQGDGRSIVRVDEKGRAYAMLKVDDFNTILYRFPTLQMCAFYRVDGLAEQVITCLHEKDDV